MLWDEAERLELDRDEWKRYIADVDVWTCRPAWEGRSK